MSRCVGWTFMSTNPWVGVLHGGHKCPPLYVGSLLCLAIKEDGQRGETESTLRSENLYRRSASTLPRHPPKRLYGIRAAFQARLHEQGEFQRWAFFNQPSIRGLTHALYRH